MSEQEIVKIADLLRRRNVIDNAIAEIIRRPMASGHLGEWIAAQVFDIALMNSAAEPAIDGHFRSGPLMGRTVNVKWYLKQEGVLDMTESAVLDFYLVLTGPRSGAVSSRYSTRLWRIDAVYLFDAVELLAQQRARDAKIGVATSVLKSQWEAAEIFPIARNSLLPLSAAQISLLRQFAEPAGSDASRAGSGTNDAHD
jgi:hypothetical protein